MNSVYLSALYCTKLYAKKQKGEPPHVERELGKEEAKELSRLENERDKIQDRLAAVLKPLKKAEILLQCGFITQRNGEMRMHAIIFLLLSTLWMMVILYRSRIIRLCSVLYQTNYSCVSSMVTHG
jgi:hypothetical protein